jgi:hypothetical protein
LLLIYERIIIDVFEGGGRVRDGEVEFGLNRLALPFVRAFFHGFPDISAKYSGRKSILGREQVASPRH